MKMKVHLVLAHEMVGVDDDSQRGACEFAEFFEHDATPQVRCCRTKRAWRERGALAVTFLSAALPLAGYVTVSP
jgi:hypothetical protein